MSDTTPTVSEAMEALRPMGWKSEESLKEAAEAALSGPAFTGAIALPDGTPPAGGLYSVDAWPPAMTDRMIINALMAKLGGMVTITPDDIMAARALAVLQFDRTADQRSIVISLILDR